MRLNLDCLYKTSFLLCDWPDVGGGCLARGARGSSDDISEADKIEGKPRYSSPLRYLVTWQVPNTHIRNLFHPGRLVIYTVSAILSTENPSYPFTYSAAHRTGSTKYRKHDSPSQPRSQHLRRLRAQHLGYASRKISWTNTRCCRCRSS